jgi:hypothetical protein
MPSDSQGVNLLIAMLLAEMLDDSGKQGEDAAARTRPATERVPAKDER